MQKYEFYRNDISIEVTARKENMTKLQMLKEASKELQREVMRLESTTGSGPSR